MKALALSLLILSAFVVAKADGLRASIETSNRQISRAMMAKDYAALDKLFRASMTKDFKYVESGKSQTYAQMMANMKMGIEQMSKLKITIKTLNVKDLGSKGTATIMHTMTGTMIGADKKTHTTSFTGTSMDTYRKEGGKWKMSKMEWKSMKMMMDGKPMPTGAGG